METPESVRSWLIERLASYLDRDAGTVDPAAEFTDLGIDSVHALILCGDVEDRFGLEVEPTMTWEHPTVALLAGHLAGELAAR